MTRIKITGYFTPADHEIDTDNRTGLTEDAYLILIGDEEGTGLRVADLYDVKVETDDVKGGKA